MSCCIFWWLHHIRHWISVKNGAHTHFIHVGPWLSESSTCTVFLQSDPVANITFFLTTFLCGQYSRHLHALFKGGIYFFEKAHKHQRWLDKVLYIHCTCTSNIVMTVRHYQYYTCKYSLSAQLSAVETGCATWTALVLAWSPSSKNICIHLRVPHIQCSSCDCYSRTVSIRRNIISDPCP